MTRASTPAAPPADGPVPDHRVRGGRGRALLVAAAAASLGVVLLRLHATGGYDVLPVPLCPFHAATGLWCPFCGGLRSVAALTRLDVAGALSSNLVVTLVLPLLAVRSARVAVTMVTGRPSRPPAVGNRTWAVTGVVLAAFAVWRNLPDLPLSAWLAP